MSGPVERLLAAADLLDKRASEATEGPWTVGSHLDMLTPPRTWHLEGVERWRGLTNDVQLGEDEATARYIATMHPEVGKLIASMLRAEGDRLRRGLNGWIADPTLSRIADLLLAGAS